MNQKPKDTFIREMEKLDKFLEKQTGCYLGYPCSADLSYCQELGKFLKYSINNCGDPFINGNCKLATKNIEKKVIKFFAKLYNLEKNYWGYVTNGGTEGNMYGIYLAREIYPKGIVYFSQDTHYSILKIARVLCMKSVVVKSQKNGEIDYNDLNTKINNNNKAPAIIIANIGTTMKGGVDQVEKIKGICKDLKTRHYIHADAALSGFILPFLKDSPVFDFSAGIESIAVSGHKMIGSPIPCGMVITKNNYVKKISKKIEYVGSDDTTLSGSRNGFTPLILWQAIQLFGMTGFKKVVQQCINTSDYALDEFKKINWPCWKNDFSNIVVIKKPPKKIIKKWQLATQEDWAHIICMRHVTKKMIDKFIYDLKLIKKI